MPRWKCLDCGREFWGWAVYYTSSRDGYECPACGGSLVGYGGRVPAETAEKPYEEATGF